MLRFANSRSLIPKSQELFGLQIEVHATHATFLLFELPPHKKSFGNFVIAFNITLGTLKTEKKFSGKLDKQNLLELVYHHK
jgi:hypothetical protein